MVLSARNSVSRRVLGRRSFAAATAFWGRCASPGGGHGYGRKYSFVALTLQRFVVIVQRMSSGVQDAEDRHSPAQFEQSVQHNCPSVFLSAVAAAPGSGPAMDLLCSRSTSKSTCGSNTGFSQACRICSCTTSILGLPRLRRCQQEANRTTESALKYAWQLQPCLFHLRVTR